MCKIWKQDGQLFVTHLFTNSISNTTRVYCVLGLEAVYVKERNQKYL